MSQHAWRLLLGPQRPTIYFPEALSTMGVMDAPIAVISAGWQESEGDISDIQALIDNPLHDLGLYQRAEALFSSDLAMQAAYRERQDQLITQQRMYQLRLSQLMIAARAILQLEGQSHALAEERRHAIAQLRALDRHHLHQMGKINSRFDDAISSENNEQLADNIESIRTMLSDCETVLITGGHVIVLINRLKLFGLGSLLENKNIIAWSAGAMALCDHVVLFHERLPQGRRDAEVTCEGLAMINDTILLPDARGRLRRDNPLRTSLFSRRFSPKTCLTLDNQSLLLQSGQRITRAESVRHLTRAGKFELVKAA